jgi:hypothetical protein
LLSCHQPQDGWTVSAHHAQKRFKADPNDPLFRLVDGATCPSDDISTPGKRRKAFDLLLKKGLFRIGLPMPSNTTLQFQILSVDDPYNCNTNSTTGLTSPQTGTVSSYRRPLPATNLGFLSTIMWDGREPSLFSQAVDATLGHAQASAAPSAAQQQQIVTFEGCTTADTQSECANTPANAGVFTAQIADKDAGSLAAAGASGGPVAVAPQVTNYFIGINDPLGNNPKNIPFTSIIFNLYARGRICRAATMWLKLVARSRVGNKSSILCRSISPALAGSTTCSSSRTSAASAALAMTRRTPGIIR